MYWTPLHRRLLPAFLAVFLGLNAKLVSAEMPKEYQKWLDEDVHWIISDRERETFLRVSSNEMRDKFIVAFWDRRDPTPGTPENEFKEEHYRRLAYSNMHFAGSTPGWKTDRGRIYVIYGPPNRIEANITTDKGTYPTEVWHYRFIEGLGQDLTWRFVDTCKCGDYLMTSDSPGKKPVE